MTRTRWPILRPILVLSCALAALVAAPTAQAADVKISNGNLFWDIDKSNPFAQNLKVTVDGSNFKLVDSGNEPALNVKTTAPCTRKNFTKEVTCPSAGVTKMTLELENLVDTAEVDEAITVPVAFGMGQGADTAKGGGGDDLFLGAPLTDPQNLDGHGDDEFLGRKGNDTFQGGLGADKMDGGEGSGDFLDYSTRGFFMIVTLGDGLANDGELAQDKVTDLSLPGKLGADNAIGIENVTGGSVRDLLIGSPVANVIDGGGGSDSPVRDSANEKLIPGDAGGVEGGAGADTLRGGAGNDLILARGPAGDPDVDVLIDCGDGAQDKVVADPGDVPAINLGTCEDVDCGPNCTVPTDPPPPAPGQPPNNPEDAQEGAGPGGGGAQPDPDGGGPQAAPPPLPPEVAIATGGIVPISKSGTIPIRVVCIYRADRCEGELTLTAAKEIKAKVGKRTRTIKKGTKIGEQDLAPLRWGNSAPVNVKASSLFRALIALQKRGSALLTATLVSRDTAAGNDGAEANVFGNVTVSGAVKKRK